MVFVSDDQTAARVPPVSSPTSPVLEAPLVEVRDVSKVFRQRGRSVEALAKVDLGIRRGEFVSLLGPSGCGKSTLLRIIGGLHDPSSGTVTVNGLTPDAARAAKQYGLVPQSPALLPWRTVAHNVRFLTGLHTSKASHAVMSDGEIDDLLETVGLDAFKDSYPHELSGGMQQRASLVRAFALGAPILLMDEPFAALDEITRADMRYLLLDLWSRINTTVVFVTHSVTEATILSDRVVVMAPRPGRIATERTIELARPRTPEMEDSTEFHEIVRVLRSDLRESHGR
ncbi:MAG: putative transporter ATP-binding protein [Ilumatobacteraceae bacterium]|nr:putative transporter ATP-binding protein [Ilumatobacteraceae bacterium]